MMEQDVGSIHRGRNERERERGEEKRQSGMSGYQWDDGRFRLALGDDCIFISPSVLDPQQSFLWSTDWLVLAASFRPSQAPWLRGAGSSILNLVVFGASLAGVL
jgi:thiamine monophosphate kinase